MEQNNNINVQNNFAGEWWKEYNMRPVRLFRITYARESLGAIMAFLYCISVIGVMTLIGVNIGHTLEEKGLGNIVFFICVGMMIIGGLVIFYKSTFENNKIRKKREELLDGDYLEVNKGFFVKRYLFCARGTGNSHKFGVFDTLKIKLCIPMIYDNLEWVKPEIGQKRGLLKGVLNGQPITFDLDGNKYE